LIRQSGEIQGPVAQALAAGLADDREPVLLACLKGLERLGLPETAEAVTALFIADGRTSVKIAAARALKRALSYSAR